MCDMLRMFNMCDVFNMCGVFNMRHMFNMCDVLNVCDMLRVFNMCGVLYVLKHVRRVARVVCVACVAYVRRVQHAVRVARVQHAASRDSFRAYVTTSRVWVACVRAYVMLESRHDDERGTDVNPTGAKGPRHVASSGAIDDARRDLGDSGVLPFGRDSLAYRWSDARATRGATYNVVRVRATFNARDMFARPFDAPRERRVRVTLNGRARGATPHVTQWVESRIGGVFVAPLDGMCSRWRRVDVSNVRTLPRSLAPGANDDAAHTPHTCPRESRERNANVARCVCDGTRHAPHTGGTDAARACSRTHRTDAAARACAARTDAQNAPIMARRDAERAATLARRALRMAARDADRMRATP